MYRPLPSFLEIKESSIEGRGVFSNIHIPEGMILGLTHIYDEDFPDNLIRLPLGGFINHSDDPNCKLFKLGRFFFMETIKAVEAKEEITLQYSITKYLYEHDKK